jgi:ADP-ribose pyrophosphatase
MKHWKRLSTKTLLSHPRLDVYEDEVELPNGQRTDYIHFGDMLDAGMVLACNNEGKFLVQEEYSYPPDEMLYQLAGGALNPGEDPRDGAAREFAEESGLAGDLELLGWFYHNNRRSSQKMYVYLATNLYEAAGAHKDLEEEFEDHWFTEEEVDRLIRDNKIRNYTFLAGWGLYKAQK